MRPAPTTATLLKELGEGNLQHAARIEEERKRGDLSSDPIITLPAPTLLCLLNLCPLARIAARTAFRSSRPCCTAAATNN